MAQIWSCFDVPVDLSNKNVPNELAERELSLAGP